MAAAKKKKSTKSTKSKSASVKTPKVNDSDLAATYGLALAVLNSDPELKGLFKTAVKKGFTPERFAAEAKNLNWYKRQSESQRNYQILRLSDPSQYASMTEQAMATMRDQYASMTGEDLPWAPPKVVNGVVQDGSGFLFQIADQALKMNWNESQIRDQLSASINWKEKVRTHTLGGATSGTLQSWREKAAAYGVQPTDDWFGDKLESVNMGRDTDEGVFGSLKDMAKQRYKAFADDIEAGHTMTDLTDNYRQSIGNVLEIPPAQVDMFDKNIQSAVNSRNAAGDYEPMNIGDFEDSLRKDSRWQYTQNAHNDIVGTGMNALRAFGLAS